MIRSMVSKNLLQNFSVLKSSIDCLLSTPQSPLYHLPQPRIGHNYWALDVVSGLPTLSPQPIKIISESQKTYNVAITHPEDIPDDYIYTYFIPERCLLFLREKNLLRCSNIWKSVSSADIKQLLYMSLFNLLLNII